MVIERGGHHWRFPLCFFFISFGGGGGGGGGGSGNGSDGSCFGLGRRISTARSRVPRDLVGVELVITKGASVSTESVLVGKGPRYLLNYPSVYNSTEITLAADSEFSSIDANSLWLSGVSTN
jgi:hypothetical protein